MMACCPAAGAKETIVGGERQRGAKPSPLKPSDAPKTNRCNQRSVISTVVISS